MDRGSWTKGVTYLAAAMVAVAGCTATAQTCTTGAEPAKGAVSPAVVSAASLRVPEKAWQHFHKAVEAERAERRQESEREIAKALAIAPLFAEPYVLRASQEVSSAHYEAAVEDILAAQHIDPGQTWAGVVLAGAYNGLQRYGDAATVLANLPGAQADRWQAKYEMARAVVGLRDAAAALHWSLLAMEAAPVGCIDTRLLRADAFLLAHRWSEAVWELTIYLKSEQPQHHRAEVLKVLDRARRMAEGAALGDVASAGAMER